MRSFRPLFFHALVFALQLAAWVPAAHAQTTDYLIARAWVDDPDGSLDLQQVRQLPALPYDGVLARGYTQSVTWLKLTVAPAPEAGPDHRLMLRIQAVPGSLATTPTGKRASSSRSTMGF